MTQTYEAVYENGVFRPTLTDAAPLAEGQRVRLVVQTDLQIDNASKPAREGEQVRQDPTLALFAQWEDEAATDDPAELARRQQEGDALQASLRESRVSLEGRADLRALLTGDEEEAA